MTFLIFHRKEEIGQSVQLRPSMNYFPDIYYLTFDEFSGFKTIKKAFNYNPSSFRDFLVKKGFFIPQNSFSNYNKTEYSISSSMNMEYPHLNRNSMRHSRVTDILEMAGYQTVTLRSSKNMFCYLDANPVMFSLYYYSMLRLTYSKRHRHFILGLLKDIENSSRNSNLKFVRFHVESPHVPFIFTAEGGYRAFDDLDNWKNKNIYLGQWIYISKRIENCIDSILNHSKQPPIIIIQSDHGERCIHDSTNWYSSQFDILNAFYLPDKDTNIIYDTISPVNTFRILFNHYFKTNFEILPDRSYCPVTPEFKQFFDITDSIKIENKFLN